ncbi:helix-turn-helix protein [Scopulibacillus darangshiensis]|uniref:Helix-turn-helix protein n=1 Tax=Scopulibacillus darangshiensis TaxID=442528 RepID=A0A4V2SKI9_9BACL|nr:helix-turn-helix transcriptional regulator [Scopulibacillus darangshiensis]TCP19706.1 helix-turn-helix protein [Scopulibacillus darangshiensis]
MDIEEKLEMENLSRSIGKTVKAHRILKDMTIEELARQADLDDKYIGEIERGKANASNYTIYKLARGLGLADPCVLHDDAKREVYPDMQKKRLE